MDIRDYEYIVAIAEQGGISKAAETLFITQSALTRFLQRTEQRVGTELFIRKGKQFLLTESGRKYVETGRAIMHLDHQLTEQLTRDMVMEKKRIRLGFSMGRTNEMLKEIFPRFYQRYPDIRIYAKAATSRKLMMELHNGALDLAVVTNVEKIPGFIQILVEKSHLVLAVPENSPLLARAVKTEGGLYPMIDPGKLNGIDMVTLPISTNSGSMVKELCERYGIQPRIVLQLSDVRSLMDAVESGLGAALFMSVPSGSKRLRYLTIRGIEEIEQDTVIVLREDKNPTAAMQYLMELIRKEHSIIE